MQAHKFGTASKYTRARRPVKLVFLEKKSTLKRAMKRELEIKTFKRNKKQLLIAESQTQPETINNHLYQ